MAAGGVLLVFGAGCVAGTGDSGPPRTTPSRAVALDVTVKQYREDQARQTVQVTVTNREAGPVVVEEVQLVSPGFDTLPPVPADATLRPAQVVDIRSGYGAARCTNGSPPASEARVVARVRPDGGDAQEVTLPVADPDRWLDRVRDRECQQQRLAAVLSVRLLPDWARGTSSDGPILRAALEVTRRGGEEVRLYGVDGSVFYVLRRTGGQQAPPLRLDPATPTTTVPIEVRAGRCDTHALAELDKRHYVFSVRVGVGGEPAQALTFQADEASQVRLRAELPYLCSG